MKIRYMIVGCIFLFNPFFNIVDILPDFIGYLFIMRALLELSDIDRNLRSARNKFKAAMWLSLAKFFLVFASMIFDSTLYLLFTFTFGLMECVYLIPAFIDLFYGISYLEGRYTDHKSRFEERPQHGGVFDKTEFASGTAYFEVYTEASADDAPPFAEENVYFANERKTVCLASAGFASKVKQQITYFYESAEARMMSVLFVIVRAACACFPELTAIAETGSSYVQSNPIDNYSGLRSLGRIFFAFVALVFGILWLIRMIRYFDTFRKDTPFLSSLQAVYDKEILPNQALFVKRRSLLFCAVATAAYAFLMCLRIDWFLLIPKFSNGSFRIVVRDLAAFFPIPEFLFGAVMIFAAFAAKNFAERRKIFVKKSIFFMLSSFSAYIAAFFLSFYYGGLLFPYKEQNYILLFSVYVILFAVSMFAFFAISKEKKQVYSRIAKEIAEISCPGSHEFSDRRRKEMIGDFEKKIKTLHMLELVYAVFSVALTLCMPFAGDYDICGLFWFFRLLFGVGLIIYSLLLTDALQKEIEKIVE